MMEDVVELVSATARTDEEDRETLHALMDQGKSSDDAILAPFTTVIQANLQGGNKAFARVGANLCFAKKAVSGGVLQLEGEEPVSFTRWYGSLGLSQDRARRYMRWVRPVLDNVDWDNDNDPILNELAAVGPCRFDEVQKIGVEYLRYTKDACLVLCGALTGNTEVRVKDLSFRAIQDLRSKFLTERGAPKHDASLSASSGDELPSGDGDGTHGPDKGIGYDATDVVGSAEHTDDVLVASSLPNNSGTADADVDDACNAIDAGIFENKRGEQSEDQNDGSDVGTDGAPAGIASAANGAQSTSTPAPALKKRTDADSARIDLSEAAPELWHYGNADVEKLTVVNGKLRANDVRVCGVNVEISVTDNRVEPAAINDNEDAFCVLKATNETTIFWFNHETAVWQSAQVATGAAQ